jgi:large subunit ribosomal protein L4e
MINVNQRRYALVSALAASAVPGLVMARGHKIEQVAEIPLVVKDEDILKVQKTKQLLKLLKKLRAYLDILVLRHPFTITRTCKVPQQTNKGRVGLSLSINDESGITNHSETSQCRCHQCQLPQPLKVAPGGHPGRFIIWTEGAYKRLEPALRNLF